MHTYSRNWMLGLLVGGSMAAAGPALAQDMHARVHIEPAGHPHVAVHVDRIHRVPPEIRAHGFRPQVTVRVNPFRGRLGWRVGRFTPHERALWTHGRWWHGRHNGRLGWWWWVDGGWYFYDAPIYPYPGYVSETYYDEEPSGDYSNYWYYCRDPKGYYPYVQTCYGSWEPVPAQAEDGDSNYGPQDQYGRGDQYGPDEDDVGPDQGPPPDEYGPDDQGPPDEDGPPDDENGPPDNGPPPR